MVKQYRHVVAFVYKFAHLSYDRGKPRGIQPTERLTLQHVNEIKPIDAIVDIAKQYQYKLPQAIVSGGERIIVEQLLQNNQLTQLFELIVCADVPVKPKPSAEIFYYVAQQLNVEPSKCHVFEDSDGGIQGALRAGMSVADVRLYL